MDQEQAMLKHYCRICKKGFSCGRALGGHMRAHGIIEDPATPDSDEDPPIAGESEWEEKPPDHFSGGKSTLYSLRPNASRVRGHRVCENCGKEFLSWKSFLDHGRCNSDDELSPPSSPHSCEKEGSHAAGWNKGKRSQRPKPSPPANWLSTEEEDLANSLIMLSSAEVDPVVFVTEPEESSASTSKEEEDPAFLTRCATEMSTPTRPKPPIAPITPPVPRGMFECKACKKVFNSHQALGGHRASHKKVKGCFAAKLDLDPYPEDDIDQIGTSSGTGLEIVTTFIDNPHPPVSAAPPLKKKSRVHECTICHRQFSSGQALGGHKRCHWITSTSGSAEIIPTTNVNNIQQQMPEVGSSSGAKLQDFSLRPMLDSSDTLDLNLPAPIDDLARIPLRLDAPAAVYIKPPWNSIGSKSKLFVYDVNNDDRKVLRGLNPAGLEDEAESKVEVAKLSDLKGMKVEEESSSWLQVGIGGLSAKRKGL